MNNQKPLQFNGGAGGYFVVFLITFVMTYIPFLGWAFAFNFTNGWLADNALVNGKKIKYNASYGEALVFIFLNSLLLFITLGIYIFWFVPKSYRFIVNHMEYVDGASPAMPAPGPVDPAAQGPDSMAPKRPAPRLIQ